MESRLRAIYDNIHGYLLSIGVIITYYRDDLGNVAVIEFQVQGKECNIYMDQDEDHIILGDLSKNEQLSKKETEDFEGTLLADGFGPVRRESGLCRVRISIGEQRDIFDEWTDEQAILAPREKLSKFDLILADNAITFLKNLLG